MIHEPEVRFQIARDPEVGRQQRLDPRLILRILWSMLRRWWLQLAAAFVIALVLGAYGARSQKEEIWKATGLMLYTPPAIPDEIRSLQGSVELANMSGLATTRPVLQRVVDDLELACPATLLEQVVDVTTTRSSKTIFISVEWADRVECQKILERLFVVYPEFVASVRQQIAQDSLVELEQQIESTKVRLDAARARYRDFTRNHNIVDFKQDIILQQTKLLSLETQLGKLTRDENAMKDQLGMLDKQIETINQQAAAEAEANREYEAANESLADNRRRQNRLRELIGEERRVLDIKSKIQVVRRTYERTKLLHEKQLVSNSQMEAVRGELEALIAQVTESKSIKNWKHELEELDEVVVPKRKNNLGSPIIHQILFTKLETNLKIAHSQKSQLEVEKEIQQTRYQIATFQKLRSELQSLEDELDSISNDRMALEKAAGMLRKLAKMGPTEFATISPPAVGQTPVSSNTKKVFVMMVMAVLAIAGTMIAAFDVLLHGIIPTDAQLGLMGLPLICHKESEHDVETDAPDHRVVRAFALQIRHRMPMHGSVFLLSPFGHPAGLTDFLKRLFRCLSYRDERVLLIDTRYAEDGIGEFGDIIHRTAIADAVSFAEQDDVFPLFGLRHWLSFECEEMARIILPTEITGLDCVLPGNVAQPEPMANPRLCELIEFARCNYSLIVILGPGALEVVDLQILASHADGIAFPLDLAVPIESGTSSAVASLNRLKAPIFGAVEV